MGGRPRKARPNSERPARVAEGEPSEKLAVVEEERLAAIETRLAAIEGFVLRNGKRMTAKRKTAKGAAKLGAGA